MTWEIKQVMTDPYQFFDGRTSSISHETKSVPAARFMTDSAILHKGATMGNDALVSYSTRGLVH